MLYQTVIRPLLFTLPPETAHTVALRLANIVQHMPGMSALMQHTLAPPPSPMLRQTLWGYGFDSPVGLAAGADKNGHYLRVMRAMGFGFEEIGSLTARPWAGNPAPRLFRLPQDEAIINRMGLNNLGVQAALPILQTLPADWPVGISLAKTPDPSILGDAALDDFAAAYAAVYGMGAYISLNISCPNTAEGKTLKNPPALDALLSRLTQVNAAHAARGPVRPWLLKLSPDLAPSQIAELADVARGYPIAGWIAANTSRDRARLKTSVCLLERIGLGGLSGPPLRQASTAMIAQLYTLCQRHAPQMVVIGVGGINSAESAWEK